MDNAELLNVALYALGLAQGLWIGWLAWRRPTLERSA